MKEIELSIEEGGDGSPAFVEAKDATRYAVRDALSLLADAEQGIGSWYDELDARADAQGALSFGEGIDFSLDEDVFIEIWGTAIDEYFADRARTAGAMPLQGYGRTMAASAYRHKIDPRLCAAVSIAESGGGQNCIRPYNAWGGERPTAIHVDLPPSGAPSRRTSRHGTRAWRHLGAAWRRPGL